MSDVLFSAAEYASRIAAVRRSMADQGLEALLLTAPENIYYLAGLSHQGYFAFTLLLLPAEGTLLLVSRSMERTTIARQAPDVEHVPFADEEDPAEAVARAVTAAGLSRACLGVTMNSIFFPPRVWDELREALPGVMWADASGVVEHVRSVKSPAEIACVRQAAALSDRAVRAAMEVAGVGVNQREVAAEAYRSMVLGGSEYPGFAPLIRSTGMLLLEHATWQDRVLTAGEGVFLELSASVARYHAPLTRMVHLAQVPPEIEVTTQVACAGLDAAVAALKPGVTAGYVYACWQEAVHERLGDTGYRRHHCGYEVGIGFPPSWVGSERVSGLSPNSKLEIEAGMVFHVLSWILGQELPDYGISDTVLVTDQGGELLTSSHRNPRLLG